VVHDKRIRRLQSVTAQLHPSLTGDDHIRGETTATITVTVFGDYECPDSARLWRVLRDLRMTGTPFLEAFRHFPLSGVHPHAITAAQAAEAAAEQAMFWPMHDVLFDRRHALEVADLAAYATELGLDVERFEEGLAYEAFADAVHADQRSGISSGVTTTPAIFVNGVRMVLEDPERLPDTLRRLSDAAQ
jgi:protein-disulfide isomerase